MDFIKILFRGDRVIWFVFFYLCALSLIEVYSATSTLAYRHSDYWIPVLEHGKHLLIGLVLVLFVHHLPYRLFGVLPLGFFITIILLCLTPFIGIEINNEPRWVRFFGVTFQPSELSKICSIGYVAFILSRINRLFSEKQAFWVILAGVVPTAFLIFVFNASTALLLLVVVFSLMLIGPISWSRLLKLGAVSLTGLGLFITFLCLAPPDMIEKGPLRRATTWQSRILTYGTTKEKETEEKISEIKITKQNYQKIHAKIALAKGGLSPQLPGHGTQRDFLPQAYSDFIYAIIIEELGLIVGFFTLFVYIVILIRVGMIARKCGDQLFPKYLVMGCGLMLVLQAFINISVATDFIPVTGQPLPLVSRGGTSTILSCAYIGIILSISRFAEGEAKDTNKEEQEVLLLPETNAPQEA